MPHIDKRLANHILKLDDKSVRNALKDFLDEEYISATQNRVKQIQEAIKCSVYNNERFLLDNDEWNESTISEEINGDCHKTYTVQTEIGTAIFGRSYLKLLYDDLL